MYSQTTLSLLNSLGRGKQNAKKRKDLALELGLSDRGMRNAIEHARIADMVCICNLQDGSGYFLPETKEEILEQYNHTISRGRHIFAQIKTIKRAMSAIDQIKLEEILGD